MAALSRLQETAAGITYARSFKRVALYGSSGGYVRTGVGGPTASLIFTGSSVAFVSTTDRDGATGHSHPAGQGRRREESQRFPDPGRYRRVPGPQQRTARMTAAV